ncbi:MAG: hypothetical protein U0930_13280 [Pirellulales bacterium]
MPSISRFSTSSAWMTAVLFAGISLFTANLALAQQPDKLVLVGPELENCDVTFRYFKSRLIAKAISIKVSLIDGRIEEPIEPGFDGIEIFVQARVAPVRATIFSGNTSLAAELLDKPGQLQISSGKIGRVEYLAESIDPSKDEKSLFQSLAQAINDGVSTSSIVPNSTESEIDYQCLDAFGRSLISRIGKVDVQASIPGVIAWQENNKRVIAGVLQGEQGLCNLRLLISNGKLVDVQPNCPSLPDTYFDDSLDTKSFEEQAEKLTRLIFEGDAKAAHKLYAPKFQAQVKVEQLAKLSETLKQRFGGAPKNLTLKRAKLLDYDFAARGRNLQIDHILETDKDFRCISRVVFSIPSDRNRIGKASLGAINVMPVFTSSNPNAAKFVQSVLEGFGKPELNAQVMAAYPPELAAIADKASLEKLLGRLGAQYGNQGVAIDFDLWQVSQFEDRAQASGELKIGEKDCFAEFQFMNGDRLVGFSVYGPSLAESTMGMFNFPQTLTEKAQTFWSHLLKEEAEAAHGMLDKDFQSQFSLEDLKKQLSEPELRPSKFKEVTVDSIRMSSQVARPADLMVTAYLTAQFEDGQISQVACDIGLPHAEDPSLDVYDFTNEFEVDFPVVQIPPVVGEKDGKDAGSQAIDAFLAEDSGKLLSLIDPARRENVDKVSLVAYFKNLRTILGKSAEPKSVARTVDYQVGSKRYRCNFELQCENGDALPIEAWFHRGYLERFVVSHPKINDFVNQMEDKSAVRVRVLKFVEGWFGDMNEARTVMVSSIQSTAALSALKSLKEQFEAEHGKLQKQEIIEENAGEQLGELEFLVTLQGERGSKNTKVLVDLGAFGGLVSAVTFQ